MSLILSFYGLANQHVGWFGASARFSASKKKKKRKKKTEENVKLWKIAKKKKNHQTHFGIVEIFHL